MSEKMSVSSIDRATTMAQAIDRMQRAILTRRVPSSSNDRDIFESTQQHARSPVQGALFGTDYQPVTLSNIGRFNTDPNMALGLLSFCSNGRLVLQAGQRGEKEATGEASCVASACAEIFSGLKTPGVLRTLLTAPQAKLYRKAISLVLVEVLTSRSQRSVANLSSAQQEARNRQLLDFLRQLVAAGVTRAFLVETTIDGSLQSIPLSALASYFQDAQVLDVFFRQASSNVVNEETSGNYASDLIDNKQVADSFQEASLAGLYLGNAVKLNPATSHAAEMIAEKWDDFFLRSMSYTSTDALARHRLTFAVGCMQAGFMSPVNELTERFRQTPMPLKAELYCTLFFALSPLGLPVEQLIKESKVWNHRQREKGYTYASVGAGPTLLHSLADKGVVPSEDQALRLVGDAARAGANFLAGSYFARTEGNVIQSTDPVRASLHAAIRGRARLSYALLAHEKSAEIGNAKAISQRLANIISEIDSYLERTNDMSPLDSMLEAEALLEKIWKLILEDDVVDISFDQENSRLVDVAVTCRVFLRWIADCVKDNKLSGSTLNDEVLNRALQDAAKKAKAAGQETYTLRPSSGEIPVQELESAIMAKRLVVRCLDSVKNEAMKLLRLRSHLYDTRLDDDHASRWIGAEVVFGRQKFKRARGLTYLAMTNHVSAIGVLLAAPTPSDPHDIASAYAWALVLRKSTEGTLQSVGEAMTDTFHRAKMTEASLWGMLYAALELRDFAQVGQIAKNAQKSGVNLDRLRGPGASLVVRAAALSSNASLKAVLSCLVDAEAQRRLFEETDHAGDTMYHIIARCEGRVFETFSKKSGFRPEGLVDTKNASGLSALAEACCVASTSTIDFMWRKSTSWNLSEHVEAALVEAAAIGSVRGLLALTAAAKRGPRLEALLQKALCALENSGFSDERRQVQDVLISWGSSPGEVQLVAMDSVVEPRQPEVLQLRRLVDANRETGGAVFTREASALWGQYDLLRQSSSPSKVEDSLARFDAVQRAGDMANLLNGEDLRICKDAIYNLEQRFFGRYFGRHFFAHRASVGDDQLLNRLAKYKNYGSSRFGYDDAPAILRVRQKALRAAKEYGEKNRAQGQVVAGLFAIHLSDQGIHGSGFTQAGAQGGTAAFSGSTIVRLVIHLLPNGEMPQIVSMYPVPPQGRENACFEQLMMVSA